MSDVILNPREKDFQQQYQEDKISKIGKLIMKLSGGLIKNQTQINKTLIGIIALAVIFTIIVLVFF